MADIKNIKFGALTPDKRMTLHNGTVTEVKRTYKVVDGQAVVVWDIGEEQKKVLTTDFTLRGVTSFVYEDGITQKNVSYLHPRKIYGLGSNGILSFTIEDVTISFPVDKPLYGGSNIYDLFCYRDGLWGIETKIIVHTYDGSENWEKVDWGSKYTFAVDNPDGLYTPSSNSNYIWAVSNITGAYRSYNAAYKIDNCIGIGLTKTALHLTSAISDLGQFYSVLSSLNASGNTLKMLRRLETPVWTPLPASVQNYLRSFMP